MKTIILNIVCLFLIITGCQNNHSGRYTYRAPEIIDDGLDAASLTDLNLDPEYLETAVDHIRQGRYREVHSILIVKNNQLVFEEYFKGHRFKHDDPGHHGEVVEWDRTKRHRVMSVTKSMTSACIGIAVDQGLIDNVNQSIFEYLPEYRQLIAKGSDRITIEHLLTMTSGIQGNEWLMPYSNPQNDIIKTYYASDPITHILSRPMVWKPGDNFQYYGGSNFLLGEILRHATHLDLEAFSGKYLFEPLGISDYYWFKLNKGVIDGAGGLEITPRAMAKIGVTFLNGGVWKGKRIISEQWVDRSSVPFPGNQWLNNWDDHWGMRGYAYSWWTHTFTYAGQRVEMYYAAGWGGQYMMIIPALDTVVVFTGGNYTTFRPPFDILKKYVVPAIL